MNVLWVTNVALPEASILMKEKPSAFGGWLINASKDLSEKMNGKLTITFPHDTDKQVDGLSGEKITYIPFPSIGISERNIKDYKIERVRKILISTKPDLVHIFGTEYLHTLLFVDLCNELGIKVVISIQGLVSFIAKHYMANLPVRVQKRSTIRDFLRRDNLRKQQKKFVKRGHYEIEALKKVNHVIGRTTWDKACTSIINPNVNYHFCNETLRNKFYEEKWDIDHFEKNSIFVSQASYPVKGVHHVLEALPIILKKYPDTKLYIAGKNIVESNNLISKVKINSYSLYLKELIQKFNLHDHVVFTGVLNEKEMCEQYLKANVFVCPSSIENSPNSLGEAMILGVPSIAADVGGISDMMTHEKEGFLYQSDAPYMLAYYTLQIFENKKLARYLSENSIKKAQETHNKDKNTATLLDIYTNIINIE